MQLTPSQLSRSIALALVAGLCSATAVNAAATPPFEVWMADQSRTDHTDLDGDGNRADGGTAYIFKGNIAGGIDLNSPEIFDLSAVSAAAGHPIGQRPHIGGANFGKTHFTLSYFSPSDVNSGGVSWFRISDRQLVKTILGLGQLHMPGPSPDDKQLAGVSISQQMLHLFSTDYDNEIFTLVSSTNLATVPNLLAGLGTTAAAPICSNYTFDSKHLFITFRDGGLAIFNVQNPLNPQLREVYNKDEVVGEGCSLIQHPDLIRMYTGGGAGTTTPAVGNQLTNQEYTYVWNMSTVGNGVKDDLIKTIALNPSGIGDNHGPNFVYGGRYLWVIMRVDNSVKVIDTRTDTLVNTFSLVTNAVPQPTPDVLDRSPLNPFLMFMSLRGYCPLSGPINYVDEMLPGSSQPGSRDCPGDQAIQVERDGRTPGLALVAVTNEGRKGKIFKVFPTSNIVGTDPSGNPLSVPLDITDPHGAKVVVRSRLLPPQ